MVSAAILGLGTAPFSPEYGWPVETGRTTTVQIIEQAVASGVGYIDTASDYGDSERILGESAERMLRGNVRICTKLTAGPLMARLKASLGRLRLDRIDTLLLHSATRVDLTARDVIQEMQEIKSRGLARRIGASTYGVEDARLAIESSWCDVVQVEYSILNPSVIPALKRVQRGSPEVVARTVLCRGLLTDRRNSILGDECEMKTRLNRLDRLAAEWDMTLPELAIRFALNSPADVVLVGIGRTEELEVAGRAARRPRLDDRQLAALEEFACPEDAWADPDRWPARL